MELQDFIFLGRVRQFLKQWSHLGASISLYCPASEGSQESRQEGGSCSRIFLPSTSKRPGLSEHTGQGGRLSQVLGDAEELGEDRMGSPAGQGWGIRWTHELVFSSSPAKG